MASLSVAIELGTSYTGIYLSGGGVVLREPSVIAYVGDDDNRKVLAVGEKAVQMSGKTPDRTTLVRPISEGYIVDEEACTQMLTAFIKKILPESYLFFPKIKAVLCVPTGLTVEERKMYEDVLMRSGVSEITAVPSMLAAAIGCELPVTQPGGLFVANIGGGMTEIAIISMGAIINGCSVNVGGAMMDRALMDYLVGKYGFKVGSSTAAKIKCEVGSLYPNDVSAIEVKGVSVNSMTPATKNVYATDTYDALLPYYARISEAIEGVLKMCPPELAAGLQDKGLHLCGGGSKIPGLSRVIKEVIGLPIVQPPDPELTALLGAGKIIDDEQLFNVIRAQQ